MLPEDHKDHMAACPAGVPDLFNKTEGTAIGLIENGGWEANVNEVGNGPDCTEDTNDRVINQNPTDGFLAPGKTVTITMCRWTAPEEPPPDP